VSKAGILALTTRGEIKALHVVQQHIQCVIVVALHEATELVMYKVVRKCTASHCVHHRAHVQLLPKEDNVQSPMWTRSAAWCDWASTQGKGVIWDRVKPHATGLVGDAVTDRLGSFRWSAARLGIAAGGMEGAVDECGQLGDLGGEWEVQPTAEAFGKGRWRCNKRMRQHLWLHRGVQVRGAQVVMACTAEEARHLCTIW
jgi:hypothetical protein